ncbi:hypothetical protein V2J09_015964 [Rumex salicifolius]
MSSDQIQRPSTSTTPNHGDQEDQFRDIHALTPPPPPPPPSNYNRPRSHQGWDTGSYRSTASDATNSSENFTTISREFNALVLAGSNFATNDNDNNNQHQHPNDAAESANNHPLEMIGEGEEENNPLAIVLDNQPMNPPAQASRRPGAAAAEVVSVQRVKKEEAEAKIAAWQNAKVAKINNRFKREDAVIKGWENEQVQKSTSWMKKIERKLEEKRAKAMEKMENDIAKAHRKAEERRASAEGKRGTKIARVLEVANLMRAIGKPPSKRSFF